MQGNLKRRANIRNIHFLPLHLYNVLKLMHWKELYFCIYWTRLWENVLSFLFKVEDKFKEMPIQKITFYLWRKKCWWALLSSTIQRTECVEQKWEGGCISRKTAPASLSNRSLSLVIFKYFSNIVFTELFHSVIAKGLEINYYGILFPDWLSWNLQVYSSAKIILSPFFPSIPVIWVTNLKCTITTK